MGSFDEIASGCELIEQLIRWTGEAQKRMADLAQINRSGRRCSLISNRYGHLSVRR